VISRLPLLGLLFAACAPPALAQRALGLAESQNPGTTDAGKRLTFVCPASDGAKASVFGTDVYTTDSAVCAAAIHAGVLEPRRAGVVTIVIGSGAKSFRGSERNGVTTRGYGAWPYSFTFVTDSAPGTIAWNTQWGQIPAQFSDSVAVVCPPGGKLDEIVWGTDVYTKDSAICVAAVHAGAITASKGGAIAVRRVPGLREYPATTRFGVSSKRWGAVADAFSVKTASAVLCTEVAEIERAFAQMTASVAREFDALIAGLRTNPSRAGAFTAQRDGQIAALDALEKQNIASACATSGPAITRQGSGPGSGLTPAAANPTAATSNRQNVALGEGRPQGFTPLEATACTLAAPVVKDKLGTPGNAYLVWNPVQGATGYLVARDDLGTITPDPIAATEFKHSAPLDHRETYRYRVTAVHGQGCGETRVDIVPQSPPVPVIRRIAAHDGDIQRRRGRVTIGWRLPTSDATGVLVIGPGVADGAVIPANDTGLYQFEIADLGAGDHAWIVAPVWDTPLGRYVDVALGARASAKVGLYRVVMNAIRADHETFDTQTDLDGKGDEVYAGAAAFVDGGFARIATSAVHGDVGPPPSLALLPGVNAPSRAGRVRAGTGSATGGIRSGDSVPPGVNPAVPVGAATNNTFPLLVWEGWLGGDSVVEIAPSVWESDGDLTAYNEWQTMMIEQCFSPELVEEEARPSSTAREDADRREEARQRKDEAADALSDLQREERALESGGGVSRGVLERQMAALRTGSDASKREQENARGAAAREELLVEKHCPDAKASVPDVLLPLTILTGEGKDRYVGSISRKPSVKFTSATMTFKTMTFSDGPSALPLQGVYSVWLTIAPLAGSTP
jgi:hypothetical protein